MDILVSIFALAGAIFILIATVGMVKMPDTYLRISVSTIASTLGVGLILISTMLFFRETIVNIKAIAMIVFILMTSPVSAHLIARSSYLMNVKLWKKSIIDEIEGKFDEETQTFNSTIKTEKTE